MDEAQTINTMNENYDDLISPGDIQSDMESLSSIAKILNTISDLPNKLRREFLGEKLYEDKEGNTTWVQGQKPVFIKIDLDTGTPIMEEKEMPWGETKSVYIANTEAIEEVISMIKFAGANQIQPVGFNKEDNYLNDLKEFECKLAGVLALKQKEWGLDKELLPMLHYKIKTLVQDARALSVKGNLLSALTKTVQRVEQYIENDNKKRRGLINPY